MNRPDNGHRLLGRPAGRSAGAAARNASPSPPRVAPRLAGLLLVTVGLVFLFAEIGSVATRARPETLLDRQRFGFVATSHDWREDFDVAQLGAGWYVDFARPICATRPEGMDAVLVTSVYTGYQVSPAWLGPIVDDHPGTLWAIGNEPDCIWQDNVEPEEYARIYHDLYSFIKGRDATAQIAPGGIVQATPLRLEWLDRVLAEYDRVHGGPMPADAWHIHNAIVREEAGSWGADIPPGITATQGVLRSPDDNDSMEIFQEQILTFRQWMEDNGYGGDPLIITEYGILMPNVLFGWDEDRVNAFMSNTFEYLLTATGPLGDPNDGYRLVQRWAWFSLDWPAYDENTAPHGFNGNLFNPVSTGITGYGLNYKSHTSGLSGVEHVDLSPGLFRPLPPPSSGSTAGTLTQSFQLEIRNEGNLASGPFTVELAYDGPVSGVLEEGVANVPPASSHWLILTLSGLEGGLYDLSVHIDPRDDVIESAVCNNQVSKSSAVPPVLMYLPIVSDGVP